MDNFWLVNGKLLLPERVFDGALHVTNGKIAAIQPKAPRHAQRIDARGAYIAPGLIDLHVWGKPSTVAREAVRSGTTAFLTTLGPAPQSMLLRQVAERAHVAEGPGARCLGIHLEGPFVNPRRGGALPRRGMRAPTIQELRELQHVATGRIKLITMAPELPGALASIRWCRAHGIAVSLGHSDADGATATRAVDAGASAVTHVFNGMPPLHHRDASLLNVALTDARLTAMVIADGVHVGATALRLLLRAKSERHIALVTDSIRYQGWDVTKRRNVYYTRSGVLAGSCLTMLDAVRNVMRLGCVLPSDAIQMASRIPARLIGLERSLGSLVQGNVAHLVVLDHAFRVQRTFVSGRIVWAHTREKTAQG